ncbi:MAG: CoA ester lyase [Chloroflexi bacterium]|nr:CoA ester lyase [Chloroflexota bacterium]
MTILRSLLFVPGNQPRMLERASGLKPDAFIPDMEDSVPDDEKANARVVTASYLAQLAAAGARVIPRVNSLETGLLDDDLAAVVGEHISGVSVGKIYTPEDIATISGKLESLERDAGLEVGSISLVPWIETAQAIVNLYAICTASPRIIGVAFGAEDFTNDMGIERTESETETYFARNSIAVAARAADVLALDTPYFGFRDPDGLRDNAQTAKQYGFKGKFAIHPAQIDIINQTFSPSAAEIEQARRVVEAYREAEGRGRGSTSLDGRVVDVPVVKRAEALLELAESLSSSE